MVLVAGLAAGLGLVLGAPVPVVLLAASVVVLPPWAVLAGAVSLAAAGRIRSADREPSPDDEADVLRGLAAELAAGAPVRAALVSAAERAPAVDLREAVRLADAGLPMRRVSDAVVAALPVNGRVAGSALRISAETGAPMARMAADLALRAADEGRLRRERRALTAQARASAAVVAGVPALLALAAAVSGRLDTLVHDPAGPVVLGAGIGLQAAGIAVVWLMTRGVTR